MKMLLGSGWKKAEGRGRELKSGHKFLGNVFGISLCATFIIMTHLTANYHIGYSLAQNFFHRSQDKQPFGNLKPEYA